MSKYPVNQNQSAEEEKKKNESALQKLLQKQTQKQAQTNVAEEEQQSVEQRISNSFAIFASFLEALTNPREDGKVILISKGLPSSVIAFHSHAKSLVSLETLGQCSIKYFALKTSSFFNQIVNEARSVIVAGNCTDFIFFENIQIIFLASRWNNATSDDPGNSLILCSFVLF